MLLKLLNVLTFMAGIILVIWGFVHFDYSSLKILALSFGITFISVIASEPYWSEE